jgi:hypothetical protein
MSFGNTWKKIGNIKLTCGWLDFEIYRMLGQYTNVVIESYHWTLKVQLKLGKNILFGYRVDWCIHELIGNVFTQY